MTEVFSGYRPIALVDARHGRRTFLARNEESGTRAALRLFGPESDHPHFVTEAGRRIDHPGIPQTLAVGTSEHGRYIVREWLPGVPFDRLVAEPPSESLTQRLCIAIHSLLEVVSYIHKRDCLHRNITASSVIVASDGTAGLIGFGSSCVASHHPVYRVEEGYPAASDPAARTRSDLTAVLCLFNMIWRPLSSAVVPIRANIPRPVRDLHTEVYESVDTFRLDLALALQISYGGEIARLSRSAAGSLRGGPGVESS